jgi:two-component system sensor histidine kinase UhpB
MQRNEVRKLTVVRDDSGSVAAPRGIIASLLRVPLFHKILIANIAVLALVTLACSVLAHRPGAANGGQLGLLLVAGVAASALVNALILRVALRPLTNLELTAKLVQAGDLSARVERSPVADRNLDRLAITFNAMLDSGEGYRRHLRDMAARALNATEEERKRISRELHDGTAQTMTALLVRLRVARTTTDAAARDALLERLGADISAATEEIRHIAQNLRPPALDMLGLAPAIESYARTVAETSDLEIVTDVSPIDGLTPEVELALYRIMQEALSNVARHSGAHTAHIRLRVSGRNVVASVEDDGHGFSVEEAMHGGGLGLFGMQERGAYVGAAVNIDSRAGHGTRVQVTIPAAGTARYA